MSFTVATMTLVCGIYLFTLKYLRDNLEIDCLNFDINTITASDFTVEMDITADMVKDFM